MSTSPRHDPSTASTPASQLSPDEFAALEREDVQAGKLIGRLLAFFFLYTIVVTILAAGWTWSAIQ